MKKYWITGLLLAVASVVCLKLRYTYTDASAVFTAAHYLTLVGVMVTIGAAIRYDRRR